MDPLKGKYTPFQRLLHKFQARRDIPLRRKFFMGYDLHGNTYWEFTLDGNMQRLRRKLEPYQEQLFKADYALTIPPQWLSWLRRTRVTAPTLEELVSDQLRQERIKILAQAASDKWYLEKQRMEEEHQLKLKEELQRAKQPVQASANEDPWAAADKKNPVVEEASINPRR
jgi:NADH dehydrogenase [ubiquinone] 1 alpha subcomplex assembly factor 2